MTHDIADSPIISVVAPIYNEVGAIDAFVKEAREVLIGLGLQGQYEFVLVNDGSSDGSAEKLDAAAATYRGEIKVIHLARNFGHAPAICSGLDQASGRAVILMDADLQDDPVAFGPFMEKWREGYEVVYAERTSRQESPVTRFVFWLFYRFMRLLANMELPMDTGTFSLMDRRAVDKLRSLSEQNRYIPGLRAWIGFRQTCVPVPRRPRHDRSSRVGLRGLWRLAMNAVFSFSYKPLLMLNLLGVMAFGLSLILIVFALYHRLVTGLAIKGWTSQLITISFFGGINLLGLGVIGQYLARIYDEVKRRPLYIIDRITGNT